MAIFNFHTATKAYDDVQKLYFKSDSVDETMLDVCKGVEYVGDPSYNIKSASFVDSEIGDLLRNVLYLEDYEKAQLVKLIEGQDDSEICY